MNEFITGLLAADRFVFLCMLGLWALALFVVLGTKPPKH